MKILISYAYAGIGHKKAAEAIKETLRGYKQVSVETIDVLDYTNSLFKFLYPRIYLFLINRLPLLWGFFYYVLDLKIVDIFLAPGRRFLNNYFCRKFIDFILERQPDVILCTHFLPAEVSSVLKENGRLKAKLITVITDLLPHSFWLATSSDYFIAAIDRTKKELVRRGVKEEKIKVLGIPCNSVFSIPKKKEDLIKKLGLEEAEINLLIMGGGFGSGPVEEIVCSISNLESKIIDSLQLIVICGKNKVLFRKFNRLKSVSNVKLSVYGYMDNVDEFMEVASCIITKSGGLTISESLSKKLPMIIIKPIPGQESRNCKILTDFGTAVRANTVKEAIDYLKDFIRFPEKIIGMRTRGKLLAYPDAAREIAEFIVKLTTENTETTEGKR